MVYMQSLSPQEVNSEFGPGPETKTSGMQLMAVSPGEQIVESSGWQTPADPVAMLSRCSTAS
jgi:hypothetical protein